MSYKTRVLSNPRLVKIGVGVGTLGTLALAKLAFVADFPAASLHWSDARLKRDIRAL